MAAGIDHLDGLNDPRLDLGRALAIGHSAGGQLALWAASRAGLPADAPGSRPAVRLRAVAALASVCDIEASAELMRPGQPVHDLVGGTREQVPQRYELANPLRRLPLGVPTLLVHGDADEVVPVQRSRDFAAAAREAGDEVEMVEHPGGDHMAVADIRTAGWAVTVRWLGERGWAPTPLAAAAAGAAGAAGVSPSSPGSRRDQ